MPEHALLPAPPRRHRIFGGLTERQERVFTWVAVGVVLLFMTGWVVAIIHVIEQKREIAREAAEAKAKGLPVPPPVAPTQRITTSLTQPDAKSTAYLSEAILRAFEPIRGESGKVYMATKLPGEEVAENYVAPKDPGVYKLAEQIGLATQQIRDLNIVSLVPFAKKEKGKIGFYYLGSWPFEKGGKPKTPKYENPNGFIEVTPQNVDTQVSEHFRLRNFLTKDQPNVWPKYLLLNPQLLDKLELTIQELEAMGVDVRRVTVMSGFRTPRYNVSGGNTGGRANLSRHMYGDASDIFIDNDGNGNMDDLNRDGRVDARDAEVISQAADRVERRYPALIGGVGVYSACCGHGPFTHIDVRGYRARWRGTGNG